MNENNGNHHLESDFKKWYNYSQCNGNAKLTLALKKAILHQESGSIFTINKKGDKEKSLLIISEKYNPISLGIHQDSMNEFINFLGSFNYIEEEGYPDPLNKKEPNETIDTKTKAQKDKSRSYKNEVKEKKIFNLLHKLSFQKKTLHALSFSFITFIILQIIILPTNLYDIKLGNWSKYLFLGFSLFTCTLSTISYSKYYYSLKQYKDIFGLVTRFYSFLWLFIFSEIIVIDLILDKAFNVLFGVFLILLGQVAGLITSLFLSMIIYYTKGGKMINYVQDPNGSG
jgi:hypothetical protein